MGNSIFINFDPDKLKGEVSCKTPFGYASNLYFLIRHALSTCGKWEAHENYHALRLMNNEELAVLAENAKELARIGFDNRETFPWGNRSVEIEFEEFSLLDWAIHGMECQNDRNVTLTQIYSIATLWEIDDAMSQATKEGITIHFIEKLSIAAFYLSEASEAKALDSARHWRGFSLLDMEVQFKERKSKEATSRAAARYANDPKQVAKRFVKECWQEWRTNATRYNSQSAFANDVLQKVETDQEGNPIISFDTIVKKWIPEWTKEIK